MQIYRDSFHLGDGSGRIVDAAFLVRAPEEQRPRRRRDLPTAGADAILAVEYGITLPVPVAGQPQPERLAAPVAFSRTTRSMHTELADPLAFYAPARFTWSLMASSVERMACMVGLMVQRSVSWLLAFPQVASTAAVVVAAATTLGGPIAGSVAGLGVVWGAHIHLEARRGHI